jgi:hypothetical protein
MEAMVTGAMACASFVVGLFFLKFWKSSRDRFFLYFALSFWIQGLNRIHLGISGSSQEDSAGIYIIRLIAYVLILIAIWEKNREPRRLNLRREEPTTSAERHHSSASG